jgi:hypothetical protein
MLAWENSGFSLDATVCVGAHDRVALKRMKYFRKPSSVLQCPRYGVLPSIAA